ncbi:MAG TPA: GFA family protein [Caulobacteraceae bacterium]
MQTGSCLCGAVKYEIAGELAPIQLCHCSMCRRASGTAFAANMPVRAADFRIVAGEAALKAYESRPGKQRVFCAECGSPIISRSQGDPATVRVRAGTLDDPAQTHAAYHFHADSKASWLPITDDLPQYPGPRPR